MEDLDVNMRWPTAADEGEAINESLIPVVFVGVTELWNDLLKASNGELAMDKPLA